MENYLIERKGWLTRKEDERLKAEIERQIGIDRDFALAAPLPDPDATPLHVFCEGCHEVAWRYGGAQPGSLTKKDLG